MDVPLTVLGGRGPHGLALHLLLQARGLTDYALVDPAPHWLPLYGPQGPMQAAGFLRSPRELDFSFGVPERSMAAYAEPDGSRPLADVYSLADAAGPENARIPETRRAPRLAFWRYANRVAAESGADRHVVAAAVTRLEPLEAGWRVHLESGEAFTTRAVLLATGLAPHLYLPQPWRLWWRLLPEAARAHALAFDYAPARFRGKRVAVLGSSNLATWEAAIRAAQGGAKVTLLSRHPEPLEQQLPFAACWFDAGFMARFAALSPKERLKTLKKPRVPASALPGMADCARALGVRILHHARVEYASELWGSVQLHYSVPDGTKAERYDLVIAATGATPRIRELPFLADAARDRCAPVVVSGVARHRPILDEKGRWKNLPPIYPLGAHALSRAGHGAATLASATAYLPLCLPDILRDAGFSRTR